MASLQCSVASCAVGGGRMHRTFACGPVELSCDRSRDVGLVGHVLHLLGSAVLGAPMDACPASCEC